MRGVRAGECGLTGGVLHDLLTEGAIRCSGRDENNKKVYTLVDPAAAEKILEKVPPSQPSPSFFSPSSGSGSYLSGAEPTEEDINHFTTIPNPLEHWSRHIAPSLAGLEQQKKAILLSLASPGDINSTVQRISVLLHGPPGTAKSELLQVVQRLGGIVATHRTSGVGLTGGMTSGKTIAPGVLPLSHGGAVALDELDKMSREDQAGVLEAMSAGTCTVIVGGQIEKFPAQTRVLAGCNKIEKILPELVSRFTFVFNVREPGIQEAHQIKSQIIKDWGRKHDTADNLSKYLKYLGDYQPEFPDDIRQKAEKHIGDYIDRHKITSPRKIENVIKIAITLARMEKRAVGEGDILTAIELLSHR